MTKKGKAVKLDSQKIEQALKDAGISRNEMAKQLDLDPRSLRRCLNEFKKMQPDHVIKIAEATGKPVSFFTKDEIVYVFKGDTFDRQGRQLADAGDSLILPKVGSNNFKAEDLKEWNSIMTNVLEVAKIGERLHFMESKEEKEDYSTYMASWMILANKYYSALTVDQQIDLLETCEAIAERIVSKNQSK